MPPASFRSLASAATLAAAFFASSPLQAQSWDGGGAGAGWGTAENWSSDTLPTFGTGADLSFPTTTGLTSGNTTFLGFGRSIRSLTFGADVDSALGVIFSTNNTTIADARLTFANTTANTITVLEGSTGDIHLGNPTNIGGAPGVPASTIQILGNLTVDHNGSGLLRFSRPISTNSTLSFTKTGNGTLQSDNNNLITGALNVNGGRLIANAFTTAGDFNNVSSINLGGGTLQYNTNSAGNKTPAPPVNVTAPSGLAFNNTDTTNRSLNFSGANAFNLASNLTIQTISANTTQQNLINISRNLTGSGAAIIEGFNNINSSTSGSSNFALGRIAFGGNNTAWSGNLVIRKGTAELYGNLTLGQISPGTGTIILGETGNAFGAGLLLSPVANSNITYGNNIIVRSGGFRTIRSGVATFGAGSDTFYTFNGTVTLEGDLNLYQDAINTDRRIVVNGDISGPGALTLARGNNGFFRMAGNNTGWSGNLTVARGTAEIRGNATNSAGTGHITIGTLGDTVNTALTFVPGASNGSTVSYANNINVIGGGNRSINGAGANNNSLTLSGNITLNGNVTVDHSWSTADRRTNLNGSISGSGGLTITRAGGSAATTLRMAGTNTYLGDTTVNTGASLALASTASLTSNVVVQAGARIGGPGTLGGNLTLADTANFFFYAVGLDGTTYVPMNVNGTVTLSNNFGVANLVGGSQGEVVPWSTTADGTYTLIGGATASNLSNIQNFGSTNYATIVGSPTKYVYFQGTTGLQLVVSSTEPGGGGDTTAPAAPTVALLAASDTGTLSNDLITNLTTPTIVVTLNGIGSGATAPLAGDVVKLFDGATQVATATLTAGDISAGSVNLTTSVLAPGSLSFTATVTDTAAVPNVSLASNTLVVTLDTTPPVIATPAPVSIDWGSSYSEVLPIATDAIPANPVVTPSGTVNAAKPGVYTLSYNAQDTAGNNAVQVQRTVTVAIANATTVGADGLTPLMRYALGANGPTDTVQAPVVSATSNTLVLTAVVRTDDPNLSVLGTTKTDLASGSWTTTGVSGTPAGSGVGTPLSPGRETRVYTVTTASRTFLRLEATLAP